MGCVISFGDLLSDAENAGKVSLAAGSLDEYMRLDQAAVAALNLTPPPKRLASGAVGKSLPSLRPLVALALQINEVCFDLSCIVFERLAFLMARREFLLQLKRGVLDVDDAVIESAQRLVNFRVIARLSGSL